MFKKCKVLESTDFPRRVIYCEWLLQKCCERPNFLNCILFTDETGFTRNAIFNSHNTHIWSDENPHACQEVRFQRRFSINVWAPIGWRKQLFYENQQCPQTIEELQERMKVAAATVRKTPAFFYVSVQTC